MNNLSSPNLLGTMVIYPDKLSLFLMNLNSKSKFILAQFISSISLTHHSECKEKG